MIAPRLVNWILATKFSELTGWTADAIQKKIQRGHWIEGRQYCYRDTRLHINLDAYEQWVEKGNEAWDANQKAAAQSRPATALN
jgi:hypothetical protein